VGTPASIAARAAARGTSANSNQIAKSSVQRLVPWPMCKNGNLVSQLAPAVAADLGFTFDFTFDFTVDFTFDFTVDFTVDFTFALTRAMARSLTEPCPQRRHGQEVPGPSSERGPRTPASVSSGDGPPCACSRLKDEDAEQARARARARGRGGRDYGSIGLACLRSRA
jgi:hypothetical protein